MSFNNKIKQLTHTLSIFFQHSLNLVSMVTEAMWKGGLDENYVNFCQTLHTIPLLFQDEYLNMIQT